VEKKLLLPTLYKKKRVRFCFCRGESQYQYDLFWIFVTDLLLLWKNLVITEIGNGNVKERRRKEMKERMKIFIE
jgi:hypothetical protein